LKLFVEIRKEKCKAKQKEKERKRRWPMIRLKFPKHKRQLNEPRVQDKTWNHVKKITQGQRRCAMHKIIKK
jgi:hypothetical protein